MRIGIRAKLFLIISSTLLVVLVTHTYLQMQLQQDAFDNELKQRTILMRENLQQRALSQAETLKHLIAEYIAAYKLFELSNIATQAAQETTDLEKVVVLDRLNQAYVDTSRPGYSGFYIPELDLQTPSQLGNKDSLELTKPLNDYKLREVKLNNSEGLEFSIPIVVGQETWGHLILVYSLSSLNAQIIESTKTHKEQQDELNMKTLIITLLLLLIAYLVISQIASRLITPILTLTSYTRDLAQGDFSHIKEISNPRTDEIGVLTQNFIQMANNLEQNHKALANYNQTLEQKVDQRTYALNLKNSALKQTMSELEDSQQQLIHSEKMAALGQLIAGIAHEINTPLGAIKASAGNNSKSFRHFENNLPEFLFRITDNDKALLKILLSMSISKIEKGVIASTREERKQKKEIVNYLEAIPLDNAEALTELLLDMIEVSDLDELAPFLKDNNAYSVVNLAHNLSALERNNQTILTAISKASKVVFSLKNFSHHDMTGNKILSNINYGIQTVLVLYQNFLKQGCTVIENFGDLPDILCYPDELNQVWTNLIHNALHAMQNIGTITIETYTENHTIVVKVTDNGSGIPKEIQEKVFTSFFTTKPAGEGSGLGLGICKRIIDKHGGNIALISQPGETTFTVKLPILDS